MCLTIVYLQNFRQKRFYIVKLAFKFVQDYSRPVGSMTGNYAFINKSGVKKTVIRINNYYFLL